MVESGNHWSALEGVFYMSSVVKEMSDFTEIVVFQPKKSLSESFRNSFLP